MGIPAHPTPDQRTTDLEERARSARQAAQVLALLPCQERNRALQNMAQALGSHISEILAANQQDLSQAADMVKQQQLSPAAFARLKLDADKLAGMIAGIETVAQLADPVGQVHFVRELDEGLILERRTYPLGVLGVVFESRPDAVTQIVSLAIKTGNSVLLKGGQEALHTCQILTQILQAALREQVGFPEGAVQLLTSRAEIQALLSLDRWVDLIVPRGSNAFVRYIQSHTRIPVLGHADGICHLYVDQAANRDQAVRLTLDSKIQYPAACNALETLLVHRGIAADFLPMVGKALTAAGVEMRGCPISQQFWPMQAASEVDWQTEYGEKILAIRVVDSLAEALDHIQTYGSRHTEAIVTEDPVVAQTFLDRVDAAGVFHNASTRFADGFRYGFGAEVGISTQKMPPRGPVGLEGLVTYKYLLRGQGQQVADYSGNGGRAFTHRDLPISPDRTLSRSDFNPVATIIDSE
ncbi:MAG: glutamate-5-semialdehyde dehydrogenase [Cyanobacteriota bacterium]|nr:glutamate-5-semialdehyde dehydrogenase [Cyanobacteriota bacterium]